MTTRRQIDLDTPDLFAQPGKQSPEEQPALPPATASAKRYALPSDLGAALRFLSPEELTRLSVAVGEEVRRREIERHGPRAAKELTAPPAQDAQRPSQPHTVKTEKRKPKIPQPEPLALTTARISAVRAAFKAGMKPGTIARQFGITQAQVRQALAGN